MQLSATTMSYWIIIIAAPCIYGRVAEMFQMT